MLASRVSKKKQRNVEAKVGKYTYQVRDLGSPGREHQSKQGLNGPSITLSLPCPLKKEPLSVMVVVASAKSAA